MQVNRPIVGGVLALFFVLMGAAAADTPWTEGRNYFLINPARPPAVGAGKVEVTEVFSYGCPACNLFVPEMHKLKQALPANAVLTYIPASFNPAEDWPMFQKAFFTAQMLGVAEQAHDAMFDAVWKTGRTRHHRPGLTAHQGPPSQHRRCGAVLQSRRRHAGG